MIGSQCEPFSQIETFRFSQLASLVSRLLLKMSKIGINGLLNEPLRD
jgi:hypothetical protein